MSGPLVPVPAAVVIGAGTMGAAIAALLHDRGFPVTLLDLDTARLEEALQRLRTADPPALDFPERATDLARLPLADADAALGRAGWVIEAIPERADLKASLYSRIAPFLAPDAILTTNTSAISITELAAGLPFGLSSRFFGLHFFNPPRQLDLVEVIRHPGVDPLAVERALTWADGTLGKTVVEAHDRPGFIANRIGIATMLEFLRTAERLRLSIEEADTAAGAALGRPRSGVFRLADRIGLDVLIALADDLALRLDEPETFAVPPSLRALAAKGSLGDKTGHGFTKREGKERFVWNPVTATYRPQAPFPDVPPVRTPADLRAAFDLPAGMGELVRAALPTTLRYAGQVAAEVADDPADIDVALREGFGWRFGPLETLAALDESAPRIQRRADSREIPFAEYRELGRRGRAVLRDGGTASLLGWETKMGILDPELVGDLRALLATAEGPVVVVGAEPHFSAGFDLPFFARVSATGDLAALDTALADLQGLAQDLADRDSTAAIRGYCLGGGFEIALGCRRIVLAPDARVGLPEARLGLLPAGGGTTRVRMLHAESAKSAANVAAVLTKGQFSDHAPHARALGYLRPTDRIAPSSRRTIFTALESVGEALPPERWTPARPELGGMIDRFLVGPARDRELTDYDVRIGERLKSILAKAKTKDEALAAERRHFAEMLGHPLTRARLAHMIEHRTPLRN